MHAWQVSQVFPCTSLAPNQLSLKLHEGGTRDQRAWVPGVTFLSHHLYLMACPSWELATGLTTATGDKESRRLQSGIVLTLAETISADQALSHLMVLIRPDLTVSLCTGVGLLTVPSVPTASDFFAAVLWVLICLS